MNTQIQDTNQTISLEVQGKTAVVTINRAQKRNALTLAL
jgi:enoyl-CoA hydratase/carnithine racemase